MLKVLKNKFPRQIKWLFLMRDLLLLQKQEKNIISRGVRAHNRSKRKIKFGLQTKQKLRRRDILPRQTVRDYHNSFFLRHLCSNSRLKKKWYMKNRMVLCLSTRITEYFCFFWSTRKRVIGESRKDTPMKKKVS